MPTRACLLMLFLACGPAADFEPTVSKVRVLKPARDAGLSPDELCFVKCPVGAVCSLVDGVCIIQR